MKKKYSCEVCEDLRWVKIEGIPNVQAGCCPFCNQLGKYPKVGNKKDWKTVKAVPAVHPKPNKGDF